MLKQILSMINGTCHLKDQRVAEVVALLLLDMAHADSDLRVEETKVIRTLLCDKCGVKKSKVDALLRDADRNIDDMNLDQLLQEIKHDLRPEDRLEVLRMLRQVLLADDYSHSIETYLMDRYRDLLLSR